MESDQHLPLEHFTATRLHFTIEILPTKLVVKNPIGCSFPLHITKI